MKIAVHLALALAVTASSMAAQRALPTDLEPRPAGSVVVRVPDKDTATLFPNEPHVSRIGSTCSFEPGAVTIEGRNLGLIWNVRVNGLNVPIVRRTATQLVIEPGAYDPGFYPVELSGPHGVVRAPSAEFTPSLTVRERRNRIEVTMHPGEAGFYWVYYSYDELDVPTVHPGIHYMQRLDVTSPRSGMLVLGHAGDGEELIVPWMTMPEYLGQIRPLKLQGFCQFDEGGEMCFTNLVRVGAHVYYTF